jgi:hypothetical protein
MRNRVTLSVLLVGLTLLTGCQRINTEAAWTLGPGDHNFLDFSAPAYNQKIRVTVTTSAEPVSVWVIKGMTEEELNTKMTLKNAPPEKAVFGARESKTKEDLTLDATVPAKTAYMVVVRNNGRKTTEVKVKVVGR